MVITWQQHVSVCAVTISAARTVTLTAQAQLSAVTSELICQPDEEVKGTRQKKYASPLR